MPRLLTGRWLGTRRLAFGLVIGSLACQLPVSAAEPQPALTPAVTIRAAGRGAPHLFLGDGQKVPTTYTGSSPDSHARPLALASADFDEDGMPDLASGYAASDGTGVITIHRGNVDALWPYGKAARKASRRHFCLTPGFLPFPKFRTSYAPAISMPTATGIWWPRTRAAIRSTCSGAMATAGLPRPSVSPCRAR